MLVDQAASGPRILLGRRRADLAFLANKYVFPGGRVDASDAVAVAADEPSVETIESLLKRMSGRPTARRARALAMAAVRELREETGLRLGQRDAPTLSALRFFARAITPPGRPRRYDTRFFMAEAGTLSTSDMAGDGELTGLDWFTLDQARTLDLPGITRLVIEDIASHLDATGHQRPSAVPFYYHRRGVFHREDLGG